MGAPRLRNWLAEWIEDDSDGVGCVVGFLLWPVVEAVVLLGLLLSPIWFLWTLLIGPGRPRPPGRSPRD